MTDRQLLQIFGRSLIAGLSVAVLLVAGIGYGESMYHGPARTVDVQYVR